jgi:hypothetical protein
VCPVQARACSPRVCWTRTWWPVVTTGCSELKSRVANEVALLRLSWLHAERAPPQQGGGQHEQRRLTAADPAEDGAHEQPDPQA